MTTPVYGFRQSPDAPLTPRRGKVGRRTCVQCGFSPHLSDPPPNASTSGRDLIDGDMKEVPFLFM